MAVWARCRTGGGIRGRTSSHCCRYHCFPPQNESASARNGRRGAVSMAFTSPNSRLSSAGSPGPRRAWGSGDVFGGDGRSPLDLEHRSQRPRERESDAGWDAIDQGLQVFHEVPVARLAGYPNRGDPVDKGDDVGRPRGDERAPGPPTACRLPLGASSTISSSYRPVSVAPMTESLTSLQDAGWGGAPAPWLFLGRGGKRSMCAAWVPFLARQCVILWVHGYSHYCSPCHLDCACHSRFRGQRAAVAGAHWHRALCCHRCHCLGQATGRVQVTQP